MPKLLNRLLWGRESIYNSRSSAKHFAGIQIIYYYYYHWLVKKKNQSLFVTLTPLHKKERIHIVAILVFSTNHPTQCTTNLNIFFIFILLIFISSPPHYYYYYYRRYYIRYIQHPMQTLHLIDTMIHDFMIGFFHLIPLGWS